MLKNILTSLNLTELFLQIIILYNTTQVLKNNNFYYIYFYFLINLVYLSIFLIVYDMDLSSVILLIVYGGLMIILLVFSLIWVDVFKLFFKTIKVKKNIIYFFIFFVFLYSFLNLKFFNLQYFVYYNFYVNYYMYVTKNFIKELELLGWGLIYYSTFIFLITSYFLFLNCLVVINIINKSKVLKSNIINSYFIYFFKNKNIIFLNLTKNQYFYNQDYENIFKKNSKTKNFKVNSYYHQIKNITRRV